MKKSLFGYGGLMSTEGLTYHDGLSIYYMTDQIRSTLLIIPLTPGFLYEAFQIVKMTTYSNIIIVIPTLDQYMISDLIQLVRLSILQKGSFHVRWVSPDDIAEWNTDIMKETHIKKDKFFLDQIFQSQYYMEPMISFEKAHVTRTQSTVYNIKLWDGEKQKIFINYIKLLNLNKLCEDDKIKEIHLPWKPTWGGITGYELASGISEEGEIAQSEIQKDFWSSNEELSFMTYKEMGQYTSLQLEKLFVEKKGKVLSNIKGNEKFRFHSFPSDTIYMYFKDKLGIKLGEVIFNALIQ